MGFRVNRKGVRSFLKGERVADFVGQQADKVAKSAAGGVGAINRQPAPYVVHREAPFIPGGAALGNEIGPPRFYRSSKMGKKRFHALVTYSHPTPKGRESMRRALMAAAHEVVPDVIDGKVLAQRKAVKKWERKNKRDAKLTPAQLQARADRRARRKAKR